MSQSFGKTRRLFLLRHHLQNTTAAAATIAAELIVAHVKRIQFWA